MFKFMVIAFISVMTGCGQSSYDGATQSPSFRKKPDATNPSNTNGTQNPSNSSADTSQTTDTFKDPIQGNEDSVASDEVIPPQVVLGGYLTMVVTTGNANTPVSAGVVSVQEEGVPLHQVKTDRYGRVSIQLRNAFSVQRITIQQPSQGISSVLNLSDLDRKNLAATITQTDILATGKLPEEVLNAACQPAGGAIQLSVQAGSKYAIDTTPPSLSFKTSDVAGGKSVTLVASDAGSGLHPEAYSFDGGKTWSANPERTFPSGTTAPAGQFVVRDNQGNTATNTFALGL
ncbi:MAG: hypothetical protein RLZZ488_636 [Pseudomonadota bacterium]|jgi:hypothetical protein